VAFYSVAHVFSAKARLRPRFYSEKRARAPENARDKRSCVLRVPAHVRRGDTRDDHVRESAKAKKKKFETWWTRTLAKDMVRGYKPRAKRLT